METYVIRQIAVMFNITRMTVLDWITSGKLKAEVRQQGLAKRYTIKKEDLEAFCRERHVRPIRIPKGFNLEQRGE